MALTAPRSSVNVGQPPRVDITEEELHERLATPGLKLVESFAEVWGPTAAPLGLKRFQASLEAPEALELLICKAEGVQLLHSHRATSVPHFLIYRNGRLLYTQAGLDTPALLAALRAHAPRAGEPVDSQENNPFYLSKQIASSGPPQQAARPRTAELLRRGRTPSADAAGAE